VPDGPDARAAAFGRWLTRERELRGLGRDEVTRATHLAPGMVEALESGERERLPARAYAVGYLRGYAAAVGLDADEVLLRFEEATGAAPPAAGARRAPGPAWLAAAALLVAAAAAAVWVLLR
jgi:cytoskeletal protein RodZ